MMRYAGGSKLVPETGYWASQRVDLDINLVALQRDVLRKDEIVLRRIPHLGMKEATN